MTFEEIPLAQDSNANQPGWPACLAMLVAWIAHIFEQITKLRQVRRTTRFKPDWQSHWPALRQSEWHRDQLLAAGAAQVLASKDIDTGYCDLIMDPPADYGGECPRTPFEMNRRFLAIAQWIKDPHAAIRRHAARIAKRCATSLRRASRAASSRRDGGDERRRRRRDLIRGIKSRSECLGRGCAFARGPPHQSTLPIANCPHPESPCFRGRIRMPGWRSVASG